MIAEFNYINESGQECSAVINDVERVDHVWWSGRKNSLGKYEKHEVTVFSAFMKKLKKCTNVRVKVYADKR